MASIVSDFGGLRIDAASALALAASLGAHGWVAAELIGAIGAGLAEAAHTMRRDADGTGGRRDG